MGSDPSPRIKTPKRQAGGEIDKIKRTVPKEGEPMERIFGPNDHPLFRASKQYYWCPHHLLWTIHKPEDCKKGKQQDQRYQYKKERTKHTDYNKHFQAVLSSLASSDDNSDNQQADPEGEDSYSEEEEDANVMDEADGTL